MPIIAKSETTATKMNDLDVNFFEFSLTLAMTFFS